MNAMDYILNKVAEECSEMVQAIMKAQNHGIEDHNPKANKANVDHILEEIDDTIGALDLLREQMRHSISKGELKVHGFPAFIYDPPQYNGMSAAVLAKKIKIAKWAVRSVRSGKLTGDLTVLEQYNGELLGGPVQMLFVCDQCNNVDIKELAYAEHNFFAGPPSVWKCRLCQGKRPSELGANLVKYDPKIHEVINRTKPGLTISMG